MFHPLALGGEAGSTIEPIHGLIKCDMGFAESGGHGVRVIKHV